MNTDAFITCLTNLGISTGASASLEGVYSPTSGSTGYFYNQLYTTGAHFQNGVLYAPTLPLVNVYNTSVTGTNKFSGVNGYRVGYQHSGNFSVLLDISYSGCSRSPMGKDHVLLSTVDKPSQLTSGFAVIINDVNRLQFKTLNKTYTLSTELSTRDFVYVALTEKQFVSLGIYNVGENTLYTKNISLDSANLATNSIYFGNFLTNDDTGNYTGFFGNLNQVILFNDDLSDSDIGTCALCSLVSGYQKSNNVFTYSGMKITGFQFSGIQSTQTTGTFLATGNVTRNDGSTVQLIYPSGMIGTITSGEVAIALTQQVNIQTSGDFYTLMFDTGTINQMTTKTFEFDLPLTNSDIVEIYNYQLPNKNIGNRIISNYWPKDTGTIQLIGNGLNETNGTDYWVLHNAISGYNDNDILTYDILSTPSIVTSYSGYWQVSRIPSGTGYFPVAPQYLESTTQFSGIVKITGLSGICTGNVFYPTFGYDLHMNGQKMISGLQYDVVTSGTSGFVVSLSGNNLPQLYAVSGSQNVDDNELTFIPQFSGFRRTQINVTTTTKTIGPVTGCSEQIWVNGIRQLLGNDYVKHGPCDILSAMFYPIGTTFNLYDSTDNVSGIWNSNFPQTVVSVDGTNKKWNLNLTGVTGEFPQTGACFDLWWATLSDSTHVGSYNYIGKMASGATSFIYTGATYIGSGSGIAQARYNLNNVIGETYTSTLTKIYP